MHHLHHQKYGAPESDTYHACCQGSQVGAPGIGCAPADNELTITVAAKTAAAMANKKMRLIDAASYPPATPGELLLPYFISSISEESKTYEGIHQHLMKGLEVVPTAGTKRGRIYTLSLDG